jgi:tRNA/rRNA methyltransferase
MFYGTGFERCRAIRRICRRRELVRAMQPKVNQGNITIVLKGPKYPGNVGSVARCAKNMGIDRLVVVGAKSLPAEEMKLMSTHVAANLVEEIRYRDSLENILGEFEFIVGTTSRQGSVRGPVISPRRMAETLLDVSQHNRVALLFGPEDRGLANDDLRYCHALVTIPTAEAFKSINLSHAVMILCYELLTISRESDGAFTPRLATAAETEGMYRQIQALLARIGFLNPQNPAYWMVHIRRFFARTKLQAKDVKIIRGFCRQMDWYMDGTGIPREERR